MKKLVVIITILILFIPKVNASTSSASSYILMDSTTGRVLMSKDMHTRRLIASITKIMTATLAIESGKLNDVVEVSPIIKEAYGSGIYIEVGEEITLKDLLLLLSIRDKIIQEIEEAIPSIEKEITPNSIGIERDITNIKVCSH